MRLPKELLSQLVDGGGGTQALFLMRGKGKFLNVYTQGQFNAEVAKYSRLNKDNSRHYRLMQFRFRGTKEVKVDSADRINVPKILTEYAGLHSEAVVSTFMNQVEIWSAEEFWKDTLGAKPEELDELSNEIFGEQPLPDAPDPILLPKDTPPAE